MLRVLWGGRCLCGPGRQGRSVTLGMHLGWEAVGECCWSGGVGVLLGRESRLYWAGCCGVGVGSL